MDSQKDVTPAKAGVIFNFLPRSRKAKISTVGIYIIVKIRT
jgi:hypothetical protein